MGDGMVSFIVPCYNEQDNVIAFYEDFRKAFGADGAIDWHLVMVDDGSHDATFERLGELAGRDERVTVISFSRNFGKEAAIYAGLKETLGSDYVGIIDADLQQPPATALEMYDILIENPQYDCVAAYQETRHEGAIMGFMKRSFYNVFARAARSSTVVANASDFRVFNRKMADAIVNLPEYHRFSKGIFSWVGFNTYAYPYEPSERNAGTTKWSFSSLMHYAIDGILSFSTSPLHLITSLGICCSAAALVYALVLIVKTIVVGVDVPGYASIVALILLFGSVQLLAIGVIGEYLARLYEQEKQRPIYIVRHRLNGMEEQRDAA
jgi:glycosyltransferase involved in cell wall biosynthesis